MNQYGTRWKSRSKYVDIDTGEEIRKQDIKKYYIIIATDKHTWLSKNKMYGTIEYTIKCKRNPQLQIWGEPKY